MFREPIFGGTKNVNRWITSSELKIEGNKKYWKLRKSIFVCLYEGNK